MLDFIKNKVQTFECNIEIEGGSVSNAKPRLIFSPETNDSKQIFFEGNIEENGTCLIDITPDGSIGKAGKIILEIIVDDTTIFQPWTTDYNIITEQAKVEAPKVKIKENKNVPKIVVKNIPDSSIYILKENDKHFKAKILKEEYQKVTEFMSSVKTLKKEDKQKLMKSLEDFTPKKNTLEWANSIFLDPKSKISKISMFLEEKTR